MVVTGIDSASDGSSPDGIVTLAAPSAAWICCGFTPRSATAMGSSVIVTRSDRPPLSSTDPTPVIPSSCGMISASAMRPRSVSEALPDEMAATTTGDALMLSAWTSGSTPWGSDSPAIASSIALVASSMSVPYSNWAVTKPMEFADVERTWSMPATDRTARSIGSTTCVATSSAPAAGNGAMTVATGKATSGSSSCFRLPQARTPATKSPPARRKVTLRRPMAARVSQFIAEGSFRRVSPHRSAGRSHVR